MGSFHQTCAVTHMPIEYGDKIVCFLLAKPREEPTDFDGYSSAGSVWQPITLPFSGTYDDYGSVDSLDLGAGGPVSRAAATMDVAEVLDRARTTGTAPTVNLKGYWGETPLTLMMVHSAVWDHLSASYETPLGKTVTCDAEVSRIGEFMDRCLEMSVERGRSVMKALNRGDGCEPPGLVARVFDEATSFLDNWATSDFRGEPPLLARFFNIGEGGIHPILRISAKNVLNQMIDECGMDAVDEVLKACLQIHIFDANMGALRRTWMPQTGLGSLSTNLELHHWVGTWVQGMSDHKARSVDGDDDLDAHVRVAP